MNNPNKSNMKNKIIKKIRINMINLCLTSIDFSTTCGHQAFLYVIVHNFCIVSISNKSELGRIISSNQSNDSPSQSVSLMQKTIILIKLLLLSISVPNLTWERQNFYRKHIETASLCRLLK